MKEYPISAKLIGKELNVNLAIQAAKQQTIKYLVKKPLLITQFYYFWMGVVAIFIF